MTDPITTPTTVPDDMPIPLDRLTDSPLYPDVPDEITRDTDSDVPLPPDHDRLVRAAVPFIVIGAAIVVGAMFALQWPSAADGTPLVTGSFTTRIANKVEAVGIGGTLADLSLYLIVAIGLILAVILFLRKDRAALYGVVAVGILGLAYLSGLVAYVGPMVGVCGFSLILFAGLITLLATRLPKLNQVG